MPRLPEIRTKDHLPEDKRHIIDYLVETRGYVSNGFSVLINSPEMGFRVAQLHTRDAVPAGAKQESVDALNANSEEVPASEQEAIGIRFARELLRERKLSDEAFEQARTAFGDQGALDLVATVAYYSMLGVLHNAMQVRPAAGTSGH